MRFTPGQVGFDRCARPSPALPPLNDLTPDSRTWRVDWFGELSYPVTVPRQSQPSLQVVLSALRADTLDAESLLMPEATEHAHQRAVWVPVGALPMLSIGSLWRQGAALPRVPYEESTFSNVVIASRSASIVKAGLALGDNFLLPLDEHPGHRHHTQSYCACVELGEGKRLLVPCLELLRFYFGSSSNLIHRLTGSPLREESLWRVKSFDERSRHLHLALAPRLAGVSAADIGRIALSKPAWAAAASFHASCIKHASLNEPVYPYAGFPIRGKTTLRASGRWLSHGGRPRSTFLVYQLLNCSHPFPFASLSYELDWARAFRPRPQRNQPATKESIGTVALLRQGEDRARLGDKDPTRGRTGRTRPRFGADRFPDLQKKPVWLEKLDVATSADILLKRPDGSVDLVTFGEPTSTGVGRAVDVIAAPAPVGTGPGDLPAFLREAIRRASARAVRDGVPPRVELVTPPGYAQAVFSLPLLVDEDGVIDPITRFTRSSGRYRQRRGCFLKLSAADGKTVYGLLLVLEGASHREPPTLSEVPVAEISLLARILAKVSIAPTHPS